MPSTNISLGAAFAAARKKGIVTKYFIHDLLCNLQSGDVKATCAEFVKANLSLVHEHKSLKEAIDAIHLSKAEKEAAFKDLSRLACSVRHYRFADDYYTFRLIDGWIEVYTYGDTRKTQEPAELNSEFLAFAWVDLKNYVILCDDIASRSRREYMKIEINRLDFDRMIGRRPKKIAELRGPKRRLYDPEVEKKAIDLIRRNPTITWKRFFDQVIEWLGMEIGLTQFRKYYGKHWTENDQRRKALGI